MEETQPRKLVPLSEENIETIAKCCWDMNRNYCQSIGDYSQPEWNAAPDILKESVKVGVVNYWDNPDMTPRDSHAAWLAYKENEGWVYGPVKDAEAKTHPCMVPYDELPESQRAKDDIFMGVVKDFMAASPREAT